VDVPDGIDSLENKLLMRGWYRSRAIDLKAQYITAFSSLVTINPELAKNLQQSMNEFTDLIWPGTSEVMAKTEAQDIEDKAQKLRDYEEKLADYNARAVQKLAEYMSSLNEEE